MTTAYSSTGSTRPRSRVERRKAQTRQKLIGAARAMLASDTAALASIQEITEAADVGFGYLRTSQVAADGDDDSCRRTRCSSWSSQKGRRTTGPVTHNGRS